MLTNFTLEIIFMPPIVLFLILTVPQRGGVSKGILFLVILFGHTLGSYDFFAIAHAE